MAGAVSTGRATAAMQVHLSRSETEECLDPVTGAEYQAHLVDSLQGQARARGRRSLQVYATDGRLLVERTVQG